MKTIDNLSLEQVIEQINNLNSFEDEELILNGHKYSYYYNQVPSYAFHFKSGTIKFFDYKWELIKWLHANWDHLYLGGKPTKNIVDKK